MSPQAQSTEEKKGRLDSWKAIADYLGRDVRSVQRWESERGLPIHRIPGSKGGGVFAYSAELEAWLQGKSEAPGTESPSDSGKARQQPENPEGSIAVSLAKSGSRSKASFAMAISVIMAAALAGGYLLLAKHAQSAAPQTVPSRPMLAVLPFTNLSGDPAQDYFADGLTEELITDVGRLDPAELGVIARTSSMKYKHANMDVAQIGRELGANFILEGSVRREGGLARISAQLIQVKDQSHLWAETYQEKAERVLDVEDQVAAAVAEKIRVRFIAPSHAAARQSATASPEAYDDYLEGLYFSNQRNLAGLTKGADFFTRAIEIDPNYAAAYAGLAQCYTLLSIDAVSNPEEMKHQARAAAAKAVALDDSSAQAHVILAGTQVLFDYDWRNAESHFRRALALDPNNALAHHWYANLYLAPMGRHDDAIAEMKVAQKLDPMSLIINTDLAYSYYLSGQDELAMTQFHEVLEMDPDFVPAHYDLSILYAKRHMYPEAVGQLAEDFRTTGQAATAATLQRIYRSDGYSGVLRVIASTKGTWGGGLRPSMLAAALAHLELGDTQQALSYLEAAYERREAGIIYLHADPSWQDLRSEPRFQALERRIGFTDQLGQTN